MKQQYPNHPMTDAEARQALADACKQVETNLPLYTYQCQNHSLSLIHILLIVFLSLQKYFVQGVASTGIKG